MSVKQEFYVEFWGVRGTVPVFGDEFTEYGGRTPCVEVRCAGRHIIFDAGTGLFELGKYTNRYHTDIFLSHTHLDHIQGLPFYRPLHTPGSNIALWSGHIEDAGGVEEAIGRIMQSPVFPLTIHDVQSKVEFNNFTAGEDIKNAGINDAGIEIKTLLLNHPDRATGYRINCYGKSVCYITDIEHEIGTINEELVEFIKGADVFIYDSTYDDESFERFKGWGHSTWQQGMRIAEKAKVGTFVAFHHDPIASDDVLYNRELQLQKLSSGRGTMAKEGMSLDILKLSK